MNRNDLKKAKDIFDACRQLVGEDIRTSGWEVYEKQLTEQEARKLVNGTATLSEGQGVFLIKDKLYLITCLKDAGVWPAIIKRNMLSENI